MVQIKLQKPTDFNTRHLAQLVMALFKSRNINYTLKYPSDMYALKWILTELKKYERPRYIALLFIEWVIYKHDFKKIESLGFLRSKFNEFMQKLPQLIQDKQI